MKRADTMRRKRDFERVYAYGRRIRRGPVTVVVAPGTAELSRLGLAVSAREGGAVVRNRVRRRLRAAFARCPEGPPVDAVVRAGGEVARNDFAALVDGLCGALAEARNRLGLTS